MITRIIIARHGNTFKPDDTPTRVGFETDLPLVEEHRARSIGKYLLEHNLVPHVAYAAPLLRTMRTAELAIEELKGNLKPNIADDFKEIGYGPDENKTEDEVMLRLGNGNISKGKSIINEWNKSAKVPHGWQVSPDLIIQSWKLFAEKVFKSYANKTAMLVSSNGIMRFSPYLTGDFLQFSEQYDLKVSTGGICIFEREKNEKKWKCTGWNIKPYKLYLE